MSWADAQATLIEAVFRDFGQACTTGGNAFTGIFDGAASDFIGDGITLGGSAITLRVRNADMTAYSIARSTLIATAGVDYRVVKVANQYDGTHLLELSEGKA